MKIDKKYLDSLEKRHWNEVSNYYSVIIVPLRTKHESGYNHIAVIGRELFISETHVLISRTCDVVKFVGTGNLRIEVDMKTKKFSVFNIEKDFRVYIGFDESTITFSDSPIELNQNFVCR